MADLTSDSLIAASAELEAEADSLGQMALRLEKLAAWQDRWQKSFSEDWADEYKIAGVDTQGRLESAKNTFMKYRSSYMSLESDWRDFKYYYDNATDNRRSVNFFTLQSLRQFQDMRRLLSKCSIIVRQKAGLTAGKNATENHYYFGGVQMGDTYSAGQAGAMGPGAHAHHMEFNQAQREAIDQLDLAGLAADLSKLRKELRSSATDPDHDIILGQVAAAETAAKAGNRQQTLTLLKGTGKWALDAATTIGLNVATSALKIAFGLPS